MAASDIEFSRSSSSSSPSGGSTGSGSPGKTSGLGRNGVAAAGAVAGAAVCGGCNAAPSAAAPSPAAMARHALGVRARIGGFQIDDVAQEHLAVVEFVAPDDDGLEGERALPQTANHRPPAGPT